MAIKVVQSFNIPQKVKQITQEASLRLEKAMAVAANEIVIRTERGIGIDGTGFKGYSKSYEVKKRESGRKTSPPDLTWTGNMLRAIHTESRKESDTRFVTAITIVGGEADKAEGNQKKRPFFGLSDKQIETIKRKVKGE